MPTPPAPAIRDRTRRIIRRAARADGFRVPHSHFWCDTSDGVRLAGSLLGEAGEDVAIVLVHGFNGYRTKPPIRTLAEGLSRRFPVLVFDLRGHGDSGGACTGGEYEPLDVHAVVEHARRRGFSRVVVVGGSLGGIAVVRAAAEFADADAVVAISTPSRWGLRNTPAVRRMTWLFTSRTGRTLVRRIFGTRIHLHWGNPEPPLEVVGRIKAPLLLIHGADDHFFSPSEAKALYERASEPKRLVILPRFGHAEDGFTERFAAWLTGEIERLLALA